MIRICWRLNFLLMWVYDLVRLIYCMLVNMAVPIPRANLDLVCMLLNRCMLSLRNINIAQIYSHTATIHCFCIHFTLP